MTRDTRHEDNAHAAVLYDVGVVDLGACEAHVTEQRADEVPVGDDTRVESVGVVDTRAANTRWQGMGCHGNCPL